VTGLLRAVASKVRAGAVFFKASVGPSTDGTDGVGSFSYRPRHAAPFTDRRPDWWPAHTRTAAVGNRGRHDRPLGTRPDLRIEKTEEISAVEIRALQAGGAV
jgi:hypothetical protein